MSTFVRAPGDFRFLPLSARTTPPMKLAIHGAIYAWARQFVDGAVVLDLGCAEGFGSALLAETAATVIGVDWDADLIDVARRTHPLGNVDYVVADCQSLPDTAAYDVVMNNALVEHIGDVDALMTSACRVLRPDGLMICGTKNSEVCLKRGDGSPLYDNHLREYAATTLVEMMRPRFEQVALHVVEMNARAERFLMNPAALGMEGALVRLGLKHVIPVSVRTWVRNLVTGIDLSEIDTSEFSIRPCRDDEDWQSAIYLVAVGRTPI